MYGMMLYIGTFMVGQELNDNCVTVCVTSGLIDTTIYGMMLHDAIYRLQCSF